MRHRRDPGMTLSEAYMSLTDTSADSRTVRAEMPRLPSEPNRSQTIQ